MLRSDDMIPEGVSMREVYRIQVDAIKYLNSNGYTYDEISKIINNSLQMTNLSKDRISSSSLRSYVSRYSESKVPGRGPTKSVRKNNKIAVYIHNSIRILSAGGLHALLPERIKIEYLKIFEQEFHMDRIQYKISDLHTFTPDQILSLSLIMSSIFGHRKVESVNEIPSNLLGGYHLFYISYMEPIVVRSVFRIEEDRVGIPYYYFKHYHPSKFGGAPRTTLGPVVYEGNALFLIGRIDKGKGNSFLVFRAPMEERFQKIVGINISIGTTGQIINSRVVAVKNREADYFHDLERMSFNDFERRRFPVSISELKLSYENDMAPVI